MSDNKPSLPNNQQPANNQTNKPTPPSSQNQKPQEPIVKNNNDAKANAFDWKPVETKSKG